MSHHHGKTDGPICPKFYKQIHLSPEMFYLFIFLFIFLFLFFIKKIIWSGRGFLGGGVRKGMGGDVRVGDGNLGGAG